MLSARSFHSDQTTTGPAQQAHDHCDVNPCAPLQGDSLWKSEKQTTLHSIFTHTKTCRVWTNFAKTIRTYKIVKWSTVSFICTTKTIVRIPVFWNKFGWPVTIIVMGILMQNHKCNEVETAFPIFNVSRLVRVHTDSHHNGHNKMIFAVSSCDRKLDR